MNYGEVLGKTWKIFWKFKILWLVGVFPYFIYAIGLIPTFLVNPALLSNITSSPAELTGQEWLVFLPSLIMFIFAFIYMALLVLASAANSIGVLQAEGGADHLSLADLIKDAGRFYWRTLGLYAMFIGAAFLIYIVLMGCFFLSTFATMGMGSMCIFPFFFLLIPLFLVGYILAEQSKAALIADNLGVVDGLKRGWEVLKVNFWRLALMGLILYGGTYVLSFIMIIPLYIIMFLPMISSIMANQLPTFDQNFSTMFISMAVFMPVYMMIQGFIFTYIRSAWMITYLRLTRPVVTPEALPVENA